MKGRVVKHRYILFVLLIVGALSAALVTQPSVRPARAQDGDKNPPAVPVIPAGSAYRQTNLVSDVPGFSLLQDPLLVNPWGIAMLATSPFWITNNGTSTATLYGGDVSGSPLAKNALTVTIPGGLPTGAVSNATSDFVITSGGGTGPARFIFASITGNIVAWRAGSVASILVSNPGHVYTGLAIGANGGGNRLYAADFANNKIDVFTGTFAATTVSGGFVDLTIPVGFAVHNIQNIGGFLYVTYAKVDPMTGRELNGAGFGFVRRFNTDGVRDSTFGINNGTLDAPWGLAIAPASFGIFPGALLVGNFSDATNSKINAFNLTTGAFLGTLKSEAGVDISIDGLWALQFGNGVGGGDTSTLYFSAGPAAEEHGLFGSLKPTTASATSLVQFATDTFAIGEGSGHIDVSVTRAGDASGTATVNVNTYDASQAGHASQKSDYEISLSKVTFNPGETSKTVRVLITDDNFVEGSEVVNLALSNPTGPGVGLGSPNQATLTINDNDVAPSSTNPVDTASFFVRQHYLDFLNREPDSLGLSFWTNNITSCGANPSCIDVARINTSAAFFLSNEFQNTGTIAYLANRAAFGLSASGSPTAVLYGQFERDVQQLQQNLVFGQPGFDAQLDANKQAYFNDFVTRPDFLGAYPATLTNAQYVDNLLASAGLTPSQVRLFVVNLSNSQEVPPTTPTFSGGGARPASFGIARFQLNAGQTAMTFTATINNIDVTGSQTPDTNDNLVAAHIHAGASVQPGVNGSVVWGFFGTPFNDNNPNDSVVTPTSGGVGGTFSGKWDAPEGNATTLAAQLTNFRTGHAYINFHTTQFGGGEIRADIPAEDAFRNSLVNGLNSASLTRAQVLRAIAESEELKNVEFTRIFVSMEYFGYLRRDPDTAGFNFWLNKLNSFNGNFQNAEMVKAFITSGEYRQRFGP